MSKFTISKSHDFIVYRVDGVVTCIRCAITGRFVSKAKWLQVNKCEKVKLFYLTRIYKQVKSLYSVDLKIHSDNERIIKGVYDDIKLLNRVLVFQGEGYSIHHKKHEDVFTIIDNKSLKCVAWVSI